MIISLCVHQETPDFVNSLSLKVEIEQENADGNPVLDIFSPSAFEFFVSHRTSTVTYFILVCVFVCDYLSFTVYLSGAHQVRLYIKLYAWPSW